MEWYSDDWLRATLPGLADVSAADLRVLVADAFAVYRHAEGHPGIADADLRAWGEASSIDPDRLSAALALLQASGKLFPFARGVLDGAPPAAASRIEDAFTSAELRKGVDRLGLDLPKSATKAELAAAIARAEG